ncbi:YitT family protein [Salipaludibacillus agaradhaerens]|uniref:YczE/YyaS/YitT family protein n=1 Tax=Salipaludibacillus agaradhaerens TaxID=76935 RepID=UPI002151BFBB|nr:YitT family protein [Salipaludibacillus agaradhaerens]MCR6106211.1 YitT family protein [Salipaludibacillus agaradhaerens]MCR6118244.1 YitT family protein [Salipaludibacillus agaradhaerens]
MTVRKGLHYTETPWFRWGVFLMGLIVMSFGIALMITAGLGSAPWDVLHIGLTKHFGFTIGTWTVIMGFLLLLLSVILTKEWPKLGAYLNMLLVGGFVDLFLFLMDTPHILVLKLVMLLVGILIMGFGIGLYISPQCGAGPRDSVMLALSLKTGMSVARVRVLMEICVLFIGWLLGGPVFIGTILFSLLIGHITALSLSFCQQWLDRRVERGMQVENIN